MNDNTKQLIEQLSEKLGVTADKVWNVLIAQAPIAGSIGILKFLIIIPIGYGLYVIHKKYDSYRKNNPIPAYDSDGGLTVLSAIWVVWAIIAIVGLIMLPEHITAFINPEYWALNKILTYMND